MYPGDLTGGVSGQIQIGSNWVTGTYDPFGIIDFNGDQHNDIITTRPTFSRSMSATASAVAGPTAAANSAPVSTGPSSSA
jgi:hypothetical protein